jgi:hypothetical protein
MEAEEEEEEEEEEEKQESQLETDAAAEQQEESDAPTAAPMMAICHSVISLSIQATARPPIGRGFGKVPARTRS